MWFQGSVKIGIEVSINLRIQVISGQLMSFTSPALKPHAISAEQRDHQDLDGMRSIRANSLSESKV